MKCANADNTGTVDGPMGVRLCKNLARARVASAAPLRYAPVPLGHVRLNGTVKLPLPKAAGKAYADVERRMSENVVNVFMLEEVRGVCICRLSVLGWGILYWCRHSPSRKDRNTERCICRPHQRRAV